MPEIVVVREDGQKYAHQVTQDNLLGFLQETVNGYIEHVRIRNDISMFVNDEFLLHDNLQLNVTLSRLCGQRIYGNGVLVGPSDAIGNTTSAPIQELTKLIGDIPSASGQAPE